MISTCSFNFFESCIWLAVSRVHLTACKNHLCEMLAITNGVRNNCNLSKICPSAVSKWPLYLLHMASINETEHSVRSQQCGAVCDCPNITERRGDAVYFATISNTDLRGKCTQRMCIVISQSIRTKSEYILKSGNCISTIFMYKSMRNFQTQVSQRNHF